MPDVLVPGWLAAGAVAGALIWWLHRFHHRGNDRVVSAAFLWQDRRQMDTGGPRRRPADRRWWVRGLVAVLVALALARPLWPAGGGRVIDVWFDESLSMAADEDGSSRAETAADLAVRHLSEAGAERVRVRSLATPGRALDLPLADPAAARAALSAWMDPRADGAMPPLPAEMDDGSEHWLVSDGADATLAPWAATAPLRRVVAVGRETENAALTRLSVRAAPADPGTVQGMAEAFNAGLGRVTRTVEVRLDGAPVIQTPIDLAPQERRTVPFVIPLGGGVVEAHLAGGDAVEADDALSVDIGGLAPVPAAVDAGCGEAVAAALRAHPAIVLAPATAAGLQVRCGPEEPVGVGAPVVWFATGDPTGPIGGVPAWRPEAGPLAGLVLDPAWLNTVDTALPATGYTSILEAGGRTLIALRWLPAPLVAVHIDVASRRLTEQPAFAALVAGLLELAAGRPLIGRSVTASRPPTASVIAPRVLGPAGGGGAARTLSGAAPVESVLLALALALLLWDSLSRRSRAPRALPLRLAVMALIAAALWNPTLPWQARPLDLIAVLDDSRSMDRQGWAEVVAAAGELPPGSRFGLVRYGAAPVIEARPRPLSDAETRSLVARAEPPRTTAMDGTFTDTEAALRTALRLAVPNRETAILAVTDGIDTHGSAERALTAAARAGIPVYRRLVEPLATPGDCRIEGLGAPDAAGAGERLRLTVAVACSGPVEGRVVLSADDRQITEALFATSADGRAAIGIDAALDRPGTRTLAARVVVPEDPNPSNDTWRSVVTVEGPRPTLVVARDGRSSPFARALVDGGLPVRVADPRELTSGAIGEAGAIVLDDIAVAEASDAAWSAIAEAVRTQGTGLVVLGGPRSFGAGGYRRSRLEELLPVIAEPRGPAPRAAVLFLVDKSGSMDQDHRGVSRFAHARQAVRTTTDSLNASDQAALIWFDRQAVTAIALRSAAAFSAVLDDAWTAAPSGGTALVPGLRAALDRLMATEADQRLLVLVTDGFSPPAENLAPLGAALAAGGIDLIALVVGDNPDVAGLRSLTGINDGTFLRVDSVANLPALMRTEVEARRAPWRTGPVEPVVVEPPPFVETAGGWPDLDGYDLTTPRPGARVYLRTPEGDPLLAEHYAGLGRVVALPGGTGAWAGRWVSWPHWGRFVGGLVGWATAPARSPFVEVDAEDRPQGIAFRVDAVDPGFAWDTSATATAAVTDPFGAVRSAPLLQTAPGRFEGMIPGDHAGLYTWTVRVGAHTVSRALARNGRHEMVRPGARRQDGSRSGREPIPWAPGIRIEGGDSRLQPEGRGPLAMAALALFVIAIAQERVGLGGLASAVRARAGRRLRWPGARNPDPGVP